jgi:uncharacterized delta-60 repeat protein/uncharacterized repeat protein (TIGR01451 family)
VLGGVAFNGTDNDFAVARFKADGTVDTSFNSGVGKVITNIAADDVGGGVAVDSQDRIVLAGYSFLAGDYDFEMARYTPAGVLDTSFGLGGTVRDNITSGQNDFGTSVAIDPAGNILMGGYSFVPNDNDFAVARFTSSGVLDTTFGTNGNTTINFTGNDFANGVAVDSIGRAVVVGQNGAANIDFAVARFTGNQVAVSATVTDGVSRATVGTTVTYTITVSNAGPDAAKLVQVADTFPAGLTGVSFTSTAAGGAIGNTASGTGNIADALTLPSGASVTYSATGTVTGPAGGNLDNIVTATPLGAFDGNAADNSATDTDAVGRQPVFTSPAVAAAAAGEPGTFTVTASGTPAAALSATGMPPGVTLTDNGNGTATLASSVGTVAGTFTLSLTAANGFGTNATQSFTLTINLPLGKSLVVGGVNGLAELFTPSVTGLYPTNPSATFVPFPGFTGSVRAASSDVDGDGFMDTILVTGPGTPIRFTVISGKDNSTLLVPLTAPFAGSESFAGGGFVAAADLDHDGKAEWVITPDQGGGPRVTIFSLVNGTATVEANFFGIDDPNFRGGARSALGDVNNDGTPDLAVAAGFLGGPRVALFDGMTLPGGTPTRLIGDFFAFPGPDATSLRNGVFVAIGDVNGDGFADMIFGAGPGGGPRVFVLSGALVSANNVAGAQAAPVANFFVADNSTDRGGVRVATKNADGDAKADLVVGSGNGDPAGVRVYLGKDFTSSAEPTTFQDVPVFGGVTLAGGVFVG